MVEAEDTMPPSSRRSFVALQQSLTQPSTASVFFVDCWESIDGQDCLVRGENFSWEDRLSSFRKFICKDMDSDLAGFKTE